MLFSIRKNQVRLLFSVAALLAFAIATGPSPARAQTAAETSAAANVSHPPYLFLTCSKGSWHLSGPVGSVLHRHGGNVEHWRLVYDRSDAYYDYYHEKSLDGTSDYPGYRWAFRRCYNPCNPQVAVWRNYQGFPDNGHWTYVCTACGTHLSMYGAPAGAAGAAERSSEP